MIIVAVLVLHGIRKRIQEKYSKTLPLKMIQYHIVLVLVLWKVCFSLFEVLDAADRSRLASVWQEHWQESMLYAVDRCQQKHVFQPPIKQPT